MPTPVSMAIRQSIISQHQEGVSISMIAYNFKVSRGTIYSLIKRYEAQGDEGLQPFYANCGKNRPGSDDFIFRAVRCIKSWHSGWGAEKIHAEMLRMRPELNLPGIRTFYRWFRWNEQTVPSTKLPKVPRQWAKDLHEGWQIDAKEEMCIADGSKQCWLNITDEHSGTVIDPPVFSL